MDGCRASADWGPDAERESGGWAWGPAAMPGAAVGEGVTGRGGDGQGQAGRGAGILTRAAGALLAGRVPDHAPRTRGAASRLSHGLRRALGGATPHSVLPVTPQCWGPRPAGSRPRPSVRCPDDPRLGRPSPLPRGAHPASPLLHPFDQTPPPAARPRGQSSCLPPQGHSLWGSRARSQRAAEGRTPAGPCSRREPPGGRAPCSLL